MSDFDCGDEDLNDFLKNDALVQQRDKLNITKLILYENQIIGFVSLLSDTLILKNIREKNVKLDIKNKLNINIELPRRVDVEDSYFTGHRC